MATTTTTRPNQANMKVIGLGLPRTGTSSLRDALNMLGFGPCHHMSTIIAGGGKNFPTWFKIGDGHGSPEDFDALFQDYHSTVDAPPALYAAELYAAYPDAKYILTTRDPAKWDKSMKSTILVITEHLRQKQERTTGEELLLRFNSEYLRDKYHRGRLDSHAEQELIDHNERVKKIIPPEKLLVYEPGEGWDRLVEFLGVPKPSEPFPHTNDTAEFQKLYIK